MAMSEKELLVEMVLALRGLSSRLDDIEDIYGEIDDELSSVKDNLKSMELEAARQSLEMANMRLQKK